MSNTQAAFEGLNTSLDRRERRLIQQKIDVLEFINTEHSSKNTKEYLKAVRASETQLTQTADLFLQLKRFPQFKEAAEKLCARCKEQELYIRDMEKRLSDDLTERYRIEDKKSMDMIKNVTFLFAIPTGFVAAVKNGFGNGIVNPYEAGGAGFSVSIAILSRKRAYRGFKDAGKALLQAPKRVKNSFLLYYVRETIKEKQSSATRAVRACGQYMNLGL